MYIYAYDVSLPETHSSPLKIGRAPERKDRLPTLSGAFLLLVSRKV